MRSHQPPPPDTAPPEARIRIHPRPLSSPFDLLRCQRLKPVSTDPVTASAPINMPELMPSAASNLLSIRQPQSRNKNRQEDTERTSTANYGPQQVTTSPLVTPPLNPSAMPNSNYAAAAKTPFREPSVRNQRTSQSNKSSPLVRRGVPHVYHDYSHVLDDPTSAELASVIHRKKTGGVAQPFPEKLHDMLDAETPASGSSVAEVVCWLPHGRAFIVRRPKVFTQEVMPKYFNQTKLTSFQRQLNLYGFRRITQGLDAGAYYHELFLRGRRGLSVRMVRQKVKGTKTKQPADVASEPNFYTMPPLPPRTPVAPPPAITAAHGSPPLPLPATVEPPSPGMRNVHHAASALTSLASGAFTFLPRVPFPNHEPDDTPATSTHHRVDFLKPRGENI